MSNLEYIQIKDLKAGMKNINAVFIVLDVGPPTLTKEAREVRTLRVADATACVNLSVWDEPGALLQPGDIVRLTRGYASLWRAALTLYSGKSGDIQKVGEFCMLFNEQVNMSEPQATPPAPPAPPSAPARNQQSSAPTTQHNNKSERFTPSATEHGKHAHKTYVRGRGHQRGNNRR
ncbi:SOSS complex subunit B homolog [Bombyx mandarina]|uniref:SOSS complex subunit B homolog n=2 Tax=Bombyx TaxID=7090 RepID=A0A8R1WK60_BOMMO|nr:SOSS complex subunit B homolog [Bombyx mori]XP_028038803.1 SOSS complex subunit B homolog [Bombyx mandarina]